MKKITVSSLCSKYWDFVLTKTLNAFENFTDKKRGCLTLWRIFGAVR